METGVLPLGTTGTTTSLRITSGGVLRHNLAMSRRECRR